MEPNPEKPVGQRQNGYKKPYQSKNNNPQRAQKDQNKKNNPEEQTAEDMNLNRNQQGMNINNQNSFVNPFENNHQGQQQYGNNNQQQDGGQQKARYPRNPQNNQPNQNNKNGNNNISRNNNSNNSTNNNNNYNPNREGGNNNRQNQRGGPPFNKSTISRQNVSTTSQQEDLRTGVFIVDEFGKQFVKEIVNGEQIKDRLYLYPNQDSNNRAIHESTVQFQMKTEQQYSNKTSNKAQILNVLDYNIQELVGQFGSKTDGERPKIDFDIASKTFDYSADCEFYFYPFEIKYPRMICKLTDAEKCKYSKGQLFKNYFKVNFVQWTEEMTDEGPECKISEMMGPLYEKQADIDALLSTIQKSDKGIKKQEIEEIPMIKKKYKQIMDKKKQQRFTNRTNLKVATIDCIGTSTFDDAISIQEIAPEAIQMEINKAIAYKSKQDEEDKKEPKEQEEKKKKQDKPVKQKDLPKATKKQKNAKNQSAPQKNLDSKKQVLLNDDKNNDSETKTPSYEIPVRNELDQSEQKVEQKENQQQEQEQHQQGLVEYVMLRVGTIQNSTPQVINNNKTTLNKKPQGPPTLVENSDNKKLSKNAKRKQNKKNKIINEEEEEEKKVDQDSEEEEGKKEEVDDSDEDTDDENDTEESTVPLEKLESSSSSGIYRIGIHVSELSETIQKSFEVYKGAEKRGQSMYLKFGKRSKAVSHMLPIELLKLFSLKKDSIKLTNTLFFCIKQSESNPNQFQILWETLRFELCKIKPVANYTYDQLDSVVSTQSYLQNNLQQQLERVKIQENLNEDQDMDVNDEEYKDYLDGQKNQQNDIFMWSPRETIALVQFGQFLSQRRESLGQKVFQDDVDENNDRSLSSLTVEELMVFFNQEVSRKLQVKQHLIKGQNQLNKEITNTKQKLMLLVKDIEKQLKVLQKRENPIKEGLSKMKKLMNQKVTQRSKKQKQIINNEKILKKKQKQLEENTKQKEFLCEQLLKLQRKQENELNSQEKEDVFEEQEWGNTILQQLKNFEQEEEEEYKHEESEIVYQKENQPEEINPQFNNSEGLNDESYQCQNDDESQSEQGDINEISDIAQQIYNPFDGKLRSIQALIISKDKDIQDVKNQILAKQQEQLSLEAHGNNFEREKRSFLKQVVYFEKQCKEVGFEDLRYGDLDELNHSFDKLKKNRQINDIVKKYLLFRKRAICRDLSQYFGIVEKERKEKKVLEDKIKQLTEKLKKETTEKDSLISKQRKLETESEEYMSLKTREVPAFQFNQKFLDELKQEVDANQQEQEEIDREEDIQMKYLEYHQRLNCLDDSVSDSDAVQQYLNSSVSTQDGKEKNQIQQKYKKSLLKLQRSIDSIDKQQKDIEKFIQENPSTIMVLNVQLEKLDGEIDTHQKKIAEIEEQVQTLSNAQKELKDEIKKLQNQNQQEIEELKQTLKSGSEDLFKYQEIIPESNVYVTASSPIRKFADMFVQQMFIKYILSNEGNSNQFNQEYAMVLSKKDKSTVNHNIVRQYQEKASTLINFRNILYAELKQGKSGSKMEEILQIKSAYFKPKNDIDFFVPDECCQVRFLSSDRSRNVPNFQIWTGLIQPKQTLPFGFVLTNIRCQVQGQTLSLTAN